MASKAIGFLNFKFGADLSGFERAMTKAQKKLKRFGTQLQKTGKSMTMGLTLPIVGVGIASAKMSMSFDKSMTKVITLVGIAEDEVKQMRDSVLELSDKTGIAAAEMAEGLFFLTSAGLRGANALETLEAVAKASASGLGDMESLSKVAAAAQNAYGVETLTAADALDAFGGMVKSGMFEANELSQVLGQQMGLASTLGISMEELGAFIATYTKTTGSATAATVGLENVMMSFAKITPMQEKALDDINMTVEELRTSLSEQGLQKTLIMMASKFKAAGVDMSDFFKGSSALKGVLGVLGNQTDTYIDILGELEGATFNVNDAFDRTSKMAGFQMTKSFNQLKNAGIEMGDALAPIILKISEKIQLLAKWFRGLTGSQKSNVIKWGLILAAIGPVLIIVGKMSVGIGVLIGGFKKLFVFLAAHPWVAAAAAIATVAYAIYDTFFATEKLTTAQDDLNDITRTAEDSIMDEKIAVELLTDELVAQGLSLEDKKKALDKLQKISPEYYGHLDAATLSVEALDKATKSYTSSLLAQAKMEAAKQKLVELNKELIDLEEGWLKTKNTLLEAGFSYTDKFYGQAYDQYKRTKDPLQDRIDDLASEYTALTKVTKAEEENLKAKKNGGSFIGSLYEEMKNYELPDEDEDEDENDDDRNKKLKLSQILTKKYTDSIAGLGEKLQDLKHVYNTAAIGSDDFNTSLELINKTQEKLDAAQDTTITKIEHITLALDDGTDAAKGLYEEFKKLEKTKPFEPLGELDKFAGALGIFGDEMAIFFGTTIEEIESGLESIVTKLGDNLAQGAEDFESYGKTVLGILRDVIGGLISTGVSLAITAALENVMKTGQFWMIPILAGAAAGLARTAFNSLIPAFAAGGLVTGPTTALIGEGSGTSMANPEVVAPLDKLKSMIGGGGQNITVQGRLVGNDIYLSNERTKFNRNRTV